MLQFINKGQGSRTGYKWHVEAIMGCTATPVAEIDGVFITFHQLGPYPCSVMTFLAQGVERIYAGECDSFSVGTNHSHRE